MLFHMSIENILSTIPLEIRESPAMKGLAVLIQTLQEQLQKTQEQLTKAEAKIQDRKHRKTIKMFSIS